MFAPVTCKYLRTRLPQLQHRLSRVLVTSRPAAIPPSHFFHTQTETNCDPINHVCHVLDSQHPETPQRIHVHIACVLPGTGHEFMFAYVCHVWTTPQHHLRLLYPTLSFSHWFSLIPVILSLEVPSVGATSKMPWSALWLNRGFNLQSFKLNWWRWIVSGLGRATQP